MLGRLVPRRAVTVLGLLAVVAIALPGMSGVAAAATPTTLTVTSPTDGSIVTTAIPTFSGTAPPGTTVAFSLAGEAMSDAAGNWAVLYSVGLVPGPNTLTIYNYNCDIRTYDLSLPSCGPPTSTILIHLTYVPTTAAPVVSLPGLVVALMLTLTAALMLWYRRRHAPAA
jgi:hypothetical protein